MKKILIILCIIFQFSAIIFAQITKDQETITIIPEKLDFCIGAQMKDNTRYPILSFQCVAGPFDDWASDLILIRRDVGDTTVIDVQGYDYINYTEQLIEKNLPLTMSMRKSRKTIPLSNDSLKHKLSKYLTINLNDKKNQFEIMVDGIKISLIPKILFNVEPFYKHQYFDPLEILLVPNDVYTAYLSGGIQKNINYICFLIDFCNNHGLSLAQEKYPQIPLLRGNRQLHVFSNDVIDIEQGTSLNLGYLERYPEVIVSLRRYGHFRGF